MGFGFGLGLGLGFGLGLGLGLGLGVRRVAHGPPGTLSSATTRYREICREKCREI